MDPKPTYKELEQRIAALEKEVAEYKQAEHKLHLFKTVIDASKQESAELFRNIYEKSPIGIEVYDPQGRLLHVNDACLKMFGILDPAEIQGFCLFEDPNLPAIKKERLFKGEIIRYEVAFDFELVKKKRLYRTTKSGSAYLDVIITPFGISKERSLGGYLVQVVDNTLRKLAEEALQKAHSELEKRVEERTAELVRQIEDRKRMEEALHFTRFAVDRSSDAAFWMGSDAHFIYVNKAACLSLGYSQDELLKMTVHDIDPNLPKEAWPDHWSEIKRQGSFVLESHHRTKDGRIFPVEISVNYMKFGGKEYNCAFVRDISKRKNIEAAIRLSKREWVSTFDAMSDWVSLVDLKCRILRSNRAGEKFVKLSIEEMIGRACCELVLGTQGPIPECPTPKMLQTNQRETIDLYAPNMNRWLRISVDPVMDEDKNPVKAVYIVRDVTEFKKMEEERLKAMKLESIGILAGGIAHDFNNLLSVIVGNISLAEDDIKSEVGISENLKAAQTACLRAQELTKQLITFSKGGLPIKKIGPIGDLIRKTTKAILSGSKVTCDVIMPPDLWLIAFDEDQIRFVIRNLIVNALESMPDGGSILLKAENVSIGAETIVQGLVLSPGKYVTISIRDQGIGIPAEHLALIFDPYFSTKEMGPEKGMGLGLATAYSIINKHNGQILVESEVGVGTTFTIYLPAYEKDVEKRTPEKTIHPEKVAARTGRILLMDDEKMIRDLAKNMLERFGFDTDVAKDGANAIKLYKKAMDSGKPYDAVILDLTVKEGLGGKDAVKSLLKIDPQVKAIVSSGYSNDPVITDFKEYGFIGALAKPYSMEDLHDVLNKVTNE
uniref:histidine kinase n=1 Tax=Candidatus Desulfatibia profunda TaxID=2841695 RepID=A0A8J6TJP3_9BACT|nr:PAS domain S-box protein [Candidatus Desulfatibia profunda]